MFTIRSLPGLSAGADCRNGGTKIRLSLTSASRDEAEALLASGEADLGICRARNRSVGNEMEWRALGAIDMDFTPQTRFCEGCHAGFAARSLSGSAGGYACRVR